MFSLPLDWAINWSLRTHWGGSQGQEIKSCDLSLDTVQYGLMELPTYAQGLSIGSVVAAETIPQPGNPT
jgi:hypothetical protein